MHKSHYSILLIDDSEDDYLYIRTLLEGAEQVSFNLTWINTAAEGIAVLGQSEPIDQDLFLLNCDLEGEEKGLDLLKISVDNHAYIPCIILINNINTVLDRQAFALGASDVLCKDNLLTSRLLERSILHALERSYSTLELREMTERLTLAKTSANLGVWEYNVFADLFTWDDRTCELYGISPEEFNGKRQSWESYIYPDDLAEIQQTFQKCLESQDSFHAEFRVLLKQSKIRYIEVYAIVIGHPGQRSQRMIGVNLDISERKHTEAKLQYMNHTLEQRIIERTESLKGLNVLLKKQSSSFYHTNQLLNIVMNSIPQGIFWKNRDSIFLGGNQRFANDVRISYNDLKGKSIDDLECTAEEIAFYTQYDREVIETGEPRIHFLETLTKPDGSIVYMDMTKVPLRDQTGQIMGILGCYEDVSDRKRVELERQELLQELLRATRLKDEFLASMSHELRTPLNAILGMTEVLQEDWLGSVTPEQREALQTIHRSGTHLLELINDLLDVAKIASGHLELHFTPVNLSQLCQTSLALVQYQAVQKKITIQHSISDGFLQPVLDERRICQVLVNLLNNAVKFTAEGGSVRLNITLSPVNTSSDYPYQLTLVVEDTGIGIATEHLSRLFQPFVQVDSALNRQYAGTGLGLALVKGLVDLHQGHVSVSSEVSVGSCFTVTIPCQVTNSVPDLPPSIVNVPSLQFTPLSLGNSSLTPSLNPSLTPKPLILLAEDNPANVSTLKLYLEAQGYVICLASNGAEAIVVAQNQHPQLILMDIQMPEVDGLEAIEILRRDPDFEQTPIIALTALAMPDDRERCLAVGATDYLSKPVQLKALKDCIQRHLFKNT